MQIIDGKKIADKIKDEIVADILFHNASDAFCSQRPSLAILLVGNRPDSSLYVSLKEREAKKVGVDTNLYCFSVSCSEKELEETISFLNNDNSIDGILLQLPLPDGFNTDRIVSLISPEKDVDRFHPENLKKTGQNNLLSPLEQVIEEVMIDIKYDPAGKSACIVANSNILGDSLAGLLISKGALTKVVSADDEDLVAVSSKADILITAVGRPGFIKTEHVKKDALIIDIGIVKEADGRISGDVDLVSVEKTAGFVTPVPGGVGPITIAAALRNTLELWKRKIKERPA
jgi:methylenetetrahydrofolate dehydrogenase (NADP+)/methenyltetrahydrofolate cyclohydrolase